MTMDRSLLNVLMRADIFILTAVLKENIFISLFTVWMIFNQTFNSICELFTIAVKFIFYISYILPPQKISNQNLKRALTCGRFFWL